MIRNIARIGKLNGAELPESYESSQFDPDFDSDFEPDENKH